MRLVNLSNQTVLADKIELADSFFKRLNGLIGRPGLNKGEALILFPCNAVHTFFMRFSIDVIFLDQEAVVLEVVENLKPYKFSPIIMKTKFVVELSAGHIATTGTVKGHRLQISTTEVGYEN